MDGEMRDLERIKEEDEGGGRLALVGLAALAVVTVVLGLTGQVGAGPVEADADPLARLAPTSGLTASAPAASPELRPVDRVALTFPETLTPPPPAGERAEIAIALAAASAELRHPDPLPAADLEAHLPSILPAAMAAGAGSALARAAPQDAMLRDALPQDRVGLEAPEGHDGDFTMQVISYDSPEGARAFAAGLRARGHRAFVMQAEVPGRGTMYRVRIGPFQTMSEAQAYRHSFEESEGMNTIVIRRH